MLLSKQLFGIVGLVFLIILIVYSLKKGASRKSLGFILISYLFILLSSVEVTLNLKFTMMLALISVCDEIDVKNKEKI